MTRFYVEEDFISAACVLMDRKDIRWDLDGYGRILVEDSDECLVIELFDENDIDYEII